ncbi:hypothetical protein, partial [Streptomyces albogriseolus]|uniref:hypothetical protein n=1 Tax=Streptomyces albogriseolus TaxID=1887 RepID=UPI003F4A8125
PSNVVSISHISPIPFSFAFPTVGVIYFFVKRGGRLFIAALFVTIPRLYQNTLADVFQTAEGRFPLPRRGGPRREAP